MEFGGGWRLSSWMPAYFGVRGRSVVAAGGDRHLPVGDVHIQHPTPDFTTNCRSPPRSSSEIRWRTENAATFRRTPANLPLPSILLAEFHHGRLLINPGRRSAPFAVASCVFSTTTHPHKHPPYGARATSRPTEMAGTSRHLAGDAPTPLGRRILY